MDINDVLRNNKGYYPRTEVMMAEGESGKAEKGTLVLVGNRCTPMIIKGDLDSGHADMYISATVIDKFIELDKCSHLTQEAKEIKEKAKRVSVTAELINEPKDYTIRVTEKNWYKLKGEEYNRIWNTPGWEDWNGCCVERRHLFELKKEGGLGAEEGGGIEVLIEKQQDDYYTEGSFIMRVEISSGNWKLGRSDSKDSMLARNFGWMRRAEWDSSGKKELYTLYASLVISKLEESLNKIAEEAAKVADTMKVGMQLMHKSNMTPDEVGGYKKIEDIERDPNDDRKVVGYIAELEGEIAEKLRTPGERLPQLTQIDISRLDDSRKRNVRDSSAHGYYNRLAMMRDETMEYFAVTSEAKSEPKDILEMAKNIIDQGCCGRLKARKIELVTKKRRTNGDDEVPEEEMSSIERLEAMVKEYRTEESYRAYLLYKIKMLEGAVKALEAAAKGKKKCTTE